MRGFPATPSQRRPEGRRVARAGIEAEVAGISREALQGVLGRGPQGDPVALRRGIVALGPRMGDGRPTAGREFGGHTEDKRGSSSSATQVEGRTIMAFASSYYGPSTGRRDGSRCCQRVCSPTMAVDIPSSPADLLRRYANQVSDRGQTAVLERPLETTRRGGSDPGKKFTVLLFRDPQQSKDYVRGVLERVVPELSPAEVAKVVDKVFKTGKGIVGTWVFELAEMYCDMLRNNGLSSDIAEE